MDYAKLEDIYFSISRSVEASRNAGVPVDGFLLDVLNKLNAAIHTESATEHIIRPTLGSRWTHTNGNRYTVTGYSNDKHPSDKYPLTVHYVGDNGNHWSRPLSRWHASMTFLPTPSKQPLVTTRQALTAGRCQAVQYSDELYCQVCALRCDVNDAEPPECGRLKGQAMNMGGR